MQLSWLSLARAQALQKHWRDKTSWKHKKAQPRLLISMEHQQGFYNEYYIQWSTNLEALLNSNVLYYLTQACFHPFFKNAKLIANILSYQKTTSGSFNIYWIVSETLTNFVMIPLPKFIINNNKKLFLYLSAAYNFNKETKEYRSGNQFKQVPTQTQDAACLMRHHLGFCIYEQVVFHWHQWMSDWALTGFYAVCA